MIHEYVEVLDKYFGNVCELDIIFNFHKGARKRTAAQRLRTCSRVCAISSLSRSRSRRPRPHPLAAPSCALSLSLSLSLSLRAAYYILDELFIGGELQETNKREVMRVVVAHEALARQESDLAAGLFE